ncbi:25S rRNA (adenine645-N1)-methyltransferase [Elasticomyces elasticus]|nr:25S rRNA (adenine645-N1)-methyltransferase [Elasticomyces elasticus]
MFAVPGWSVPASLLKTQTDIAQNKSKAPDAKNAINHEGPKKRKRGGRNPAVTNENVAELWAKRFEGKKDAEDVKALRQKKKQKLERKKARKETDDVTDGAPKDHGHEDQKEVIGNSNEKNAGDGNGKAVTDRPEKEKNPRRPRMDHGAPNATESTATSKANSGVPRSMPSLPSAAKLTPLQSAMRQKLISARFRHLNQTLYTTPSSNSLALFVDNPEMFEDYHSGFRQQVAVWPENPVDSFVREIRERGRVKPDRFQGNDRKRRKDNEAAEHDMAQLQALPRTHGTSIIADLGCGDASLAASLHDSLSKLNLKILSYDLHSASPTVTKADIADLPLEDGTVDIAIFCLALMGTNWIDFIEEAYRILHWKGELWVAEIKSRFGRVGGDKGKGKVVDHSVGSKRKQAATKKSTEEEKKRGQEVNEQQALQVEVDGVESKKEETDVGAFVGVLKRRGFLLKDERSVDLSNKMFVRMEFVKAAAPTKGKNAPDVKPGEVENGKRKTKSRFIDEKENDVDTEEEAKVLRPCFYKIR